MTDELAETIAGLSIRLAEIPMDTPEYERVGAELADWLLIFSSWVDGAPEDSTAASETISWLTLVDEESEVR